jgi:hypothetical protein
MRETVCSGGTATSLGGWSDQLCELEENYMAGKNVPQRHSDMHLPSRVTDSMYLLPR